MTLHGVGPDASRHNLAQPALGWQSVWLGPDLDFQRAVPLRKSYFVASSYRCGSTFLCWKLWGTGVLGAPAEYLNVGAGRMARDQMMRRLDAVTPEDYFIKLLNCRTSKNGVFGMKVHYPHFEAALSWYPSMLRLLSPVTYIYLNRRDALAQAISMAKAIQSNAWQPWEQSVRTTLIYDGALIAQCLRDLHQQKLGWRQWFEANKIAPFIVSYEDAVADTATVIREVIELLDVGGDEPEQISLPILEKQGDAVSLEWHERFQQAVPDWDSWFPLPDL